jgi:hypothetical protein
MAEPTVQFQADAPFGTPTDWARQPATATVEKQRANALDQHGTEVFSKLYDERTNYQQDFTAAVTGDPDIAGFADIIGALVGSAVATSITFTTQADQPVQCQLSGHQHAVNAHEDDLRQVAHGINPGKSFGAVDFLGSTPGANASVFSSTATITCQHVDELDQNGDHFVGENFDARVEVVQDFVGVPATNAAAGWDVTNVETRTDNQGFEHTVVTAQKALVLA